MVKGRGKESVQVWETFIEQGRLDEKKEMREILEAGLKRAKGIRRPEHSLNSIWLGRHARPPHEEA
ncbi:MAG: hypothetical protein AAB268_03095 [Elusimicrobiota bacterium]|mgnify:CR=1 FL=1